MKLQYRYSFLGLSCACVRPVEISSGEWVPSLAPGSHLGPIQYFLGSHLSSGYRRLIPGPTDERGLVFFSWERDGLRGVRRLWCLFFPARHPGSTGHTGRASYKGLRAGFPVGSRTGSPALRGRWSSVQMRTCPAETDHRKHAKLQRVEGLDWDREGQRSRIRRVIGLSCRTLPGIADTVHRR